MTLFGCGRGVGSANGKRRQGVVQVESEVLALRARPVAPLGARAHTRLDPEKYSIANDTIVYFLNFDVWSVERHPQGSII